jgi:hypothetical protein
VERKFFHACGFSSASILVIVAAAAALVFAGFAMLLRSRGSVFNADDPVFYYVYLHSLTYDGDLDLGNDYLQSLRHPDGSGNSSTYPVNPATGRADNYFTIGLPLLVAPVYIAVHLVIASYAFVTGSPAHPSLFVDQVIYSYGSFLLGLVGIWLSFKFVCSYYPERETLAATVSFWLCSPLFYYFAREPFMSHLASVFAVSLFLYIWKVPPLRPGSRALLMGLVAGIVTMVRQQDIVVAIIPLGAVFAGGALNWRRSKLLSTVSLAAFGFIGAFVVQMLVWYSLRGSFLSFSYQGQSFENAFAPKILQVLFSSNHGLLSWHPLIGLSFVGWLALRKVDPVFSGLILLCFTLELYVIAAWWSWWLGYSFGNRGFLSLTPLFILGLASFYARLPQGWSRWLTTAGVGLLIVWNAVLMLAYVSEMIPYEGEFSWRALILQLPDLPSHIMAKIHRI